MTGCETACVRVYDASCSHPNWMPFASSLPRNPSHPPPVLYSAPMFVLDAIYFSDVGNSRIRRVYLTTGVITTVAGGGSGDHGVGGPATDATFSSHPMRVTGDRFGNLYVADAHHGRIRRINTSAGIIDTLAGCGVEGYSGDGGPAVHAQIASPHGTALDRHGNIYIADLKNDRIRKVDASTGIITTVAGTGEHGYSGDGGPATEAMLASPIAVYATAGGDLYIADHRSSRIRKVDAATGSHHHRRRQRGAGLPWRRRPRHPGRHISPPRCRARRLTAASTSPTARTTASAKIEPDGTITTVAGTGREKFSGDGGPAHDGKPLHALQHCPRPRRQPVCRGHRQPPHPQDRRQRSSIIATVAGNGSYGFSGDGGPAIDAPLAVGRRPA